MTIATVICMTVTAILLTACRAASAADRRTEEMFDIE
jgi:hypothetical protein